MYCSVQWDVVIDILVVLLVLLNKDGRHEALPISFCEYKEGAPEWCALYSLHLPHYFPLKELVILHTQPCSIDRWGQKQFYHSSTLEWLLVGSDRGRVRQFFSLGKETRFDDCHVSLICFANLRHVFLI